MRFFVMRLGEGDWLFLVEAGSLSVWAEILFSWSAAVKAFVLILLMLSHSKQEYSVYA